MLNMVVALVVMVTMVVVSGGEEDYIGENKE